MNTEGHHGVAEAAGLPLLKEVFGDKAKSLQAFYLGNWLTDVSQAVDPVAYAAAHGKANKAIENIVIETVKKYEAEIDSIFVSIYERLDFLESDLANWALEYLDLDIDPKEKAEELKQKLKDKLEKELNQQKADLQAALHSVLIGRTESRDSKLGDFFHNAFLVVGYFKFVHPEKAGEEDRMKFDPFMSVFGRSNEVRGASPGRAADDRPGAYTQYYPFEHLDRPEMLQYPGIYEPGAQSPNRPYQTSVHTEFHGLRAITQPKTTEPITPDLYSYLRDDMECTAGLLAEVDEAFTSTLAKLANADTKAANIKTLDTDANWHLTLAKLGHALHQVEDFYAHSNWVELAAEQLGTDFIGEVLPREMNSKILDTARTIYNRRLYRYIDPITPPNMSMINENGNTEEKKEKEDLEKEDWVVTGYFDFQDTLVSIGHIAEEAFGLDAGDPWAYLHEKEQKLKRAINKPGEPVDQARALMRDTLEFATNPRQAMKDEDNAVAKKVKDEYEEWSKKADRQPLTRIQVEQIAKQIPLINEAPTEVILAFVNMVILGSTIYAHAKPLKSLYESIKTVTDFVKSPANFILEKLPGKIKEITKSVLEFYIKDQIYQFAGARRIGSHSLLAKDHGSEPLYAYQRQCATAVHWYVVKMLLRDRTHRDTPAHIDWLELLEYFLRNPNAPPPEDSVIYMSKVNEGTLLYTTKKGDQLDSPKDVHSLVKQFRPTAVDKEAFTWEAIADANFKTRGLTSKARKDKINATIRDKGWGYPVDNTNYAFNPGHKIKIPNQWVPAKQPQVATDETDWWVEVMNTVLTATDKDKDKAWEIFQGWEDSVQKKSTTPIKHHTLVKISGDQHKAIINQGIDFRRRLRAAYRPKQLQSDE